MLNTITLTSLMWSLLSCKYMFSSNIHFSCHSILWFMWSKHSISRITYLYIIIIQLIDDGMYLINSLLVLSIWSWMKWPIKLKQKFFIFVVYFYNPCYISIYLVPRHSHYLCLQLCRLENNTYCSGGSLQTDGQRCYRSQNCLIIFGWYFLPLQNS
jgi:hypothetical protein